MRFRIDTDAPAIERLSRPEVDGFRIPNSHVSFDYKPPAPRQLAGVYDSLFVYIDSETFRTMLCAAAAVVGTEIVKDGYKWTKGLFRRNCEAFPPRLSGEKLGVEIRLREDCADGARPTGLVVINYREAPRAKSLELVHFDDMAFEKRFALFEGALLPIIAHWANQPGFQHFHVEGFTGPGFDDPHWNMAIELDGRLPVFAQVRADGPPPRKASEPPKQKAVLGAERRQTAKKSRRKRR